MEKDWKSIIGDYFKKHNLLRLEYLNDNLQSHCKEYVDYLNEFHNVRAKAEGVHFRENIYGIGIKMQI